MVLEHNVTWIRRRGWHWNGGDTMAASRPVWSSSAILELGSKEEIWRQGMADVKMKLRVAKIEGEALVAFIIGMREKPERSSRGHR